MTSYLVTGGAGFIGSHLVDALLKQGHEVVVLDDLSTGHQENLNPQASFIRGSVTDVQDVARATKGVEGVFHLAAQVSVPLAIENPAETNHINIEGTKILLAACIQQGIKKIVLASTCAVYGEQEGPIPETALLKPMNAYATSKLEMEQLCLQHQQRGLTSCCLRYFNVYGPRQRPDSQYAAAIPLFIRHCLDGKSITIYGDGEQTRDFIFVQDVVRANLFAMAQGEGVLNIGTGKPTSINALLKAIQEHTGGHGAIQHALARQGEIRHSVAKVDKAQKAGFAAETPLMHGLQETIAALQEKPSASKSF